jgi:hypothetical protein
MVLDPISAVSLTSAIVQFVDFSAKLISKSHEIYTSSSGVSQENVNLQAIADRLGTLAIHFNDDLSTGGGIKPASQCLSSLALSCKDVADELLQAIESLKVHSGPNRKWRTFRKALKSMWEKGRIEDLERRLNDLRSQLTIELVAHIR